MAQLMDKRTEAQRLAAEVAKRHNRVISPDDPIFLIITLNELAQEKFVERIETMLKETSYHISALNIQQREAAKAIAEQAIAGGADYVAKTALAAMEEFRAAAKETMAHELAALRRAGEEVQKQRRTVGWMAVLVIGVAAMLIGALAASRFQGV